MVGMSLQKKNPLARLAPTSSDLINKKRRDRKKFETLKYLIRSEKIKSPVVAGESTEPASSGKGELGTSLASKIASKPVE